MRSSEMLEILCKVHYKFRTNLEIYTVLYHFGKEPTFPVKEGQAQKFKIY